MASEMNENKIKHLEMIQSIVTRLNNNSFQFKSWSIVVLSALLALFANSGNELFILVAIFPTLIFWIVDSSYLNIERAFCKLYDDVVKNQDDIIPFQMNIGKYKNYKSFFNTMFSGTEVWFYGGSIALMLGLFFLLFYSCITFEFLIKNA